MRTRDISLRAVNHVTAMIAHWDRSQLCTFSNDSFREWFGRSHQEMLGISLKEILGPLYEVSLQHILAALDGITQVFERQISPVAGGTRVGIVTYVPDVVEGEIVGFWSHLADVTLLREHEAALELAIAERDRAFAEIRTLHGLLPICSGCKGIRDPDGNWNAFEDYLEKRANVSFTHGMCPACIAKYYPNMKPPG